MSSWQVQDAKARFSEFLNATIKIVTIKKGPQVVKRRRVETAVLVPIEEWRHGTHHQGRVCRSWNEHGDNSILDPRKFEITPVTVKAGRLM